MMKVNKFFIYMSLFFCTLVSFNAKAGETNLILTGLQSGDEAILTISSTEFLITQKVGKDGTYFFKDLPVGQHAVKVEAEGYNLPQSQMVRVNEDGSVNPVTGINLAITKMEENPNLWVHTWESDGSISGISTTSSVNKPLEIDFLGKKIVPADMPSTTLLYQNYNILLSDEGEPWTQEYAYRLLETLKIVPVDYGNLPLAKFTLTKDHLENDIIISDLGEGKEVIISEDAFYYSNPFLVSIEGVRGRFFSKSLHHSIVKYATDFGKDLERINNILSQRYGCSIFVEDIENLTGEDSTNFQNFYPSELVAIVNMFEEMPEGMHAIPQLKYLIRRVDGHLNPIYPSAAAISWTSENGYIEFINAPHLGVSAFGGNNEQFDTQRLILHEKTHFLWAYIISEELKNKWIEIGGWYIDPNSSSGWSTTKTTEFVTQYAHGINPDEDMAESVAFYIKNPELLQSRAIEKYEFIRDFIMHGTRYITSIPDYLTFEVLNLWPDYDYPGKIKRVDIKVEGAPEEDKLLTFEIELNHQEGYEDGASSAVTRIMSPIFYDEEGTGLGTYIDLWLGAVEGNDHILVGTANIGKYMKSGYWIVGDISVQDHVGNTRYEGRNDCITNIYVNNLLEDLEAPKYEKGSLKYELSEIDNNGHHEQVLSVKFKTSDNIKISDLSGGLYTGVDSNHMPSWSTNYDETTQWAQIDYRIRDYYYTADYYIASIFITDVAGLCRDIRFSEDPLHEPIQKIHIETPNPDYEHPEIDLNRLFVHAEPTHPEAPDGETLVNISFYMRDNISGQASYGITLRDPQGLMHTYGFGVNNELDESGYYLKDPTLWKHYNAQIVLPQGSAPGIWGIAEMNVRDLAFNDYTYNFVETLIFEPDDSDEGWILFADLDSEANLTFGLSSEIVRANHISYRIINEDNGLEINGEYTENTRAIEKSMTVNIAELGTGSIIIILTAYNEEGAPIGVKSTRVSMQYEVEAENVILNYVNKDLYIGEIFQLEATVLPEETSDKTITWTSSNNEVASVSDEGLVTAVSAGKAIITATCGEAFAECSITVLEDAGVESLMANPDSKISIYSFDGIVIKKDCKPEELKSLAKGIYIIVSGKDRYKVSI